MMWDKLSVPENVLQLNSGRMHCLFFVYGFRVCQCMVWWNHQAMSVLVPWLAACWSLSDSWPCQHLHSSRRRHQADHTESPWNTGTSRTLVTVTILIDVRLTLTVSCSLSCTDWLLVTKCRDCTHRWKEWEWIHHSCCCWLRTVLVVLKHLSLELFTFSLTKVLSLFFTLACHVISWSFCWTASEAVVCNSLQQCCHQCLLIRVCSCAIARISWPCSWSLSETSFRCPISHSSS